MSLKNDGAWHTLSAMLLYQRRHRYVIEATMMSYWFQSDVIGMPFCQGFKRNIWLFPSCYGNRYMYDSRRAWHTVYSVLLSNYMKFIRWKKTWFSKIYSSFSNNSFLCSEKKRNQGRDEWAPTCFILIYIVDWFTIHRNTTFQFESITVSLTSVTQILNVWKLV